MEHMLDPSGILNEPSRAQIVWDLSIESHSHLLVGHFDECTSHRGHIRQLSQHFRSRAEGRLVRIDPLEEMD